MEWLGWDRKGGLGGPSLAEMVQKIGPKMRKDAGEILLNFKQGFGFKNQRIQILLN
jgi:hypothetical protein